MNMNEIYERLLAIDPAAVIEKIQSRESALTQPEMMILIIAAVAGLLLCLFGLKLVRLCAALFGFAAGAAAGLEIGTAFGLDGAACVIMGAAAGLILGVLGAVIYRIGIFVTVFLSVGLFGLHAAGGQNWILVGVCAAAALVAAILSIKFMEIITILATTILGAVTVGPAVCYLLPDTGHDALLRIVLCTAFAALGILVQLLAESRKRKRQNLKRAAQIREEQSAANEVERARAVMNELDGEKNTNTAATDEKGTADADPSRKISGIETISLDDIEDIDEE